MEERKSERASKARPPYPLPVRDLSRVASLQIKDLPFPFPSCPLPSSDPCPPTASHPPSFAEVPGGTGTRNSESKGCVLLPPSAPLPLCIGGRVWEQELSRSWLCGGSGLRAVDGFSDAENAPPGAGRTQGVPVWKSLLGRAGAVPPPPGPRPQVLSVKWANCAGPVTRRRSQTPRSGFMEASGSLPSERCPAREPRAPRGSPGEGVA